MAWFYTTEYSHELFISCFVVRLCSLVRLNWNRTRIMYMQYYKTYSREHCIFLISTWTINQSNSFLTNNWPILWKNKTLRLRHGLCKNVDAASHVKCCFAASRYVTQSFNHITISMILWFLLRYSVIVRLFRLVYVRTHRWVDLGCD